MKKVKALAILLVVMMMFAGSALGAYPLYKLGLSKFADGISKVEEVYTLVSDNQADIKKGFQMAGAEALFRPLLEQLSQADIEIIDFQPQDTLLWMLYKKKNKVHIVKDVVWAAKKPFKAFQFTINHEGSGYEFVIPFICSNIALRGVTPLPPPAKVEPPPPPAKVEPPPPPAKVEPPPNQPPVCNITVAPTKFFNGEPFIIDASASSDPDGQVVAAIFTILDTNGNTVAETKVEQPPFVYEAVLPTAGNYTVKATVVDDKGATITGSDCEKQVEVTKRGTVVADVGLMIQPDPAKYMLFRVGYEYRLCSFSSILFLAGFNPLIDEDGGDNSLSIDVILNGYRDRLFAGVGVGYWYNDVFDQADFIVNLGYDFYRNPNGRSVAFFAEGRADISDIGALSDTGRIGGGFRFRF